MEFRLDMNHIWIRIMAVIFIAVVGGGGVSGQIVSTPDEVLDPDSLKNESESGPYFGLYKDNYFIFGPPVGPKPTARNTNVKFQISVAQRLTKSVLPFGSYLYLFYTQKCFWNVLQNSFPMTDLNFNPGLGFTKPLFVKNRFIGKVSLIFEHESNGKAEKESRSWNRVSLSTNIWIDPTTMVYAKMWIPWVDGENNRDLLDYYGLYQVGISFRPISKRFQATVFVTKRRGWNFNYNTVLEFSYKLFNNDNQYLFAQYYNGYGEGLLDYNKYKSQLRIGFVIKPQFFSDY